jgi:molybdopterin-guanine dinucleotide biosynthesis protein A
MTEAALILCGGRSRRMGRDKASLQFGNETLLARMVRLVGQVVPEVVLVAREGQELPAGLRECDRIARDPAEGLGPLAAIAAGLPVIHGERALVVACDMPLLRPSLARRLLDLSEGYEACVPVIDGVTMATCAVYGRAAATRAATLVAERRLRPLFLLERLNTRTVGPDDLRDVDPHLDSFRNCNTPDDYRAALRAAGLSDAGLE